MTITIALSDHRVSEAVITVIENHFSKRSETELQRMQFLANIWSTTIVRNVETGLYITASTFLLNRALF